MSVLAERHYEYAGYRCPYCNHLHHPDEAHHYSEDWCETQCGRCDQAFRVSVHHTITWTTWAKTNDHD